MAVSGIMLLVLAAAQGTGNDLVDYVDTQAYWQAEGVAMTVEAVSAHLTLPAEAGGTPKAGAVRRLVAIRTLGELKNREALPVLRGLLRSREPFVAEYARRAIATIEGKPFKRPCATHADLARDVSLLPAGCAMVAQVRVGGGGPISWDKAIALMGEAGEHLPDDARKHINTMIGQLAGQVGNLRLDGLTLAVSGKIGPQDGWVMLIGRGLYDAATVRGVLKNFAEEVRTVGNVEVFMAQGGIALMAPSNERFVMLGGPEAEALPIDEVAAALATGVGKLHTEAKMAALLASVDRTKPLWAVATMTDTYRKAEVLAPFDAITLVGDAKGDTLHLKLVARGADAEKIKTAIATFEAGRREGIDALKGEGIRVPMVKDILAFMESVRVENAGTQVTVTAAYRGSPMSMLVPWLTYSSGSETKRMKVRDKPKEPPR